MPEVGTTSHLQAGFDFISIRGCYCLICRLPTSIYICRLLFIQYTQSLRALTKKYHPTQSPTVYKSKQTSIYFSNTAIMSSSSSPAEKLIAQTKCVCLQDYRQLARQVLPVETFVYIDSGADDEITLRNNTRAFRKYVLLPRILRDGNQVSLTTSLWGKQMSMPIGFAPWAMNKMVHPLGESATATVAGRKNIPYILSTLTNVHPQQISSINPQGMKLLQAYLCNDWEMNMKLIQIAESSNFDGIVITVDAQVLGTRRKEVMYKMDTSNYEFPILQEMVTLAKDSTSGPRERVSYLKNRDLSLNWETIAKIRKLTKLKIVLKGILHPQDAAIAVNYCDAIYISNHGGRQLDTVPATIEALPRIAAVVRQQEKKVPIFIDGGVRTGNDVFKCLALGADFVFVGRPIAYSLVKGEEGVSDMIEMLKDQLTRCMILSGVANISNIGSEFVGVRARL